MELYQERVLKILFVLIWALAFIHMMAEVYFLYWVFEWFDMMTHFIGGVWLGLAGLWLWYLSGYFRPLTAPDKYAFFVALGTGILIGILWEGYEYVVWYFSGYELPLNYIYDTSIDVILDILGALLGFALFKFLVKADK